MGYNVRGDDKERSKGEGVMIGRGGGYPSNWKFSFSATVAIKRRV